MVSETVLLEELHCGECAAACFAEDVQVDHVLPPGGRVFAKNAADVAKVYFVILGIVEMVIEVFSTAEMYLAFCAMMMFLV